MQLKDELIAALVKEIQLTTPLTSPDGNKDFAQTVYFGGGTPSILTPAELSLILDALNKKMAIANDAEITLEANPDDITATKLKEWKQAGINRLSVGIQSFSEAELLWMNRAHTAADSLRCIDEIQQAGFTDYSIDLIYGSPLLSNKCWMDNVNVAIEKDIPHVSCYALTVEPKTALDRMVLNKTVFIDPELQAKQFMLLMDWMEQAGYEHYEISNFAKPAMRSRHNSSYWQGKHYYGFGPSAHSYDGKTRKWNIANNALYIRSLQNNAIPCEQELLTKTQQLNEYIMTSLRTAEGLGLEKVSAEFGTTFSEELKLAGKKYEATHKLESIKSRLVLTKAGKLFADGIAADLFFSE